MRTRTTKAAAIAGVLALTLAACGDDGNDADSAAAAEDSAASGTIVEVASSNADFSTLVAAVDAAGLVDTLNSDGPFTVFAPTDEAFGEALDALGLTAEELLGDTDTLTSILTYHVVAGEVPSTDVVTLDGQSVETVNGATVDIAVSGETVMVNDATVTAVDVEASNGVIHVIDSVLLPPADDMAAEEMSEESMSETNTIVDVASSTAGFSSLVAAAQAAGLVDTLNSDGPFTVFAPTDEAFGEALSALDITAEELFADTDTLTSILTYHVIAGEVPSSDVLTLDGQSVETVNGATVDIAIDGDSVMVNDAMVTTVDVEADNGVIHVIDSVLLPPAAG